VHPIAFQFGALTVTWYGILVAGGFLVALWAASRRAPYGGLAPETILDLGPWLIIGAIVGARLLYVITFWREQFAGQPFVQVFMVWHGGLVFYGGLIGATVGSILFARVRKIPLWKMGDVVAPSIPLGAAFGRIGCLLNGCCYGKECHLPWAIHFPQAHETYPRGVHPTEIYDALWCLVLYFLLVRLYRKKTFDGQVFLASLFGYATFRLLSEFTRGDYPADQLYFGGHITPAQIISVGIIIVAVVLWRLLPHRITAVTGVDRSTAKAP
jgi:phosphatidylglycerol---prolipoprotein diacylglyceryl transferase